MQVKGLENAIKLRMIYIDTQETIIIQSISKASRMLNIHHDAVRKAMNPLNKKRFEYNGRTVVVRSIKL